MAFQVKIDFKPYDNDEEEPQDNNAKTNENIDLSKVPKRLYLQYRDFFSVAKAARPTLYRLNIDHAIELRPNIKPPQIRIYNMSLAKLKALEDYINNTLTKG